MVVSLNRPSLLKLLSGIVFVTVVTVFTLHDARIYFIQRDKLIDSIQQQAAQSIARLSQNVAPLMESFAINEYDKLVATEIALEGHFAIVLRDFKMGPVLGQDEFVSGKLRTAAGQVIDFDSTDVEQQQALQRTFYQHSGPIHASSGEVIGSVAVYSSDQALRTQLRQMLQQGLFTTLLMALLLILWLVLLAYRFFVRPLQQIAEVMEQRDEYGIPTAPAPGFCYREVSVLADTTNRMLDVIRQSRDALQQQQTRLNNVIIGTHAGTWEWNVQSGETVFNEQWAEFIGYSLHELAPISIQTWIDLTHPDDLQRANQLLQQHFSGELPYYECEVRMRHKDGRWIWVLDRGKVFTWSADGKPEWMYGTHQDITLRKRAEEQLRQSASVFEHAHEGIMITDAHGIIFDINEAFSQITGFSREEAVGRSPRILQSGRQGAEFYQRLWSSLHDKGFWSGELWNRRKDGTLYAAMQTISAIQNDVGQVWRYIALFSDITKAKEHQYRLEHIAHYDPLTDLPNRALLGDRLYQAMVQVQRHEALLGVVYLDLDGFKSVNDLYGHQIGDQLLVLLAVRMKEALREGDTLARLGGDEFIAVLLDLPNHEASAPIIERLLQAASAPVHIQGKELRVSASIGVSFYPQLETVDADQLIRQADQAMYSAKQAGKNRYQIFDAAQDQAVRGHHEDLGRMRQALEQGEFVLHYQPKVNMHSGELVGAEALIRWAHPQRGLLYPAEFMPVLANHLLGIDLGEWVLEQACQQMEQWRGLGLDVPVSVNIDGMHLAQPDFIDHLRLCLSRHPLLRPGDLELEVLESSALADISQISQVIGLCGEIGVAVALDDFGTGYSTLTYLKRLPAHLLKIDRSFVRDMLDDPEDLAILEGVMGLARAFSRQTLADGVESVQHGNMLLSLGCHLAQGYGIARPMPAEAFPGWLADWQPDPSWRRLRRPSSDNLPLLFSMVEHRQWVAKLQSWLQQELPEPTALDLHHCQFGQWLQASERGDPDHNPDLQRAISLHAQLHQRAELLIELQQEGHSIEAKICLEELILQRDALVQQIDQLTVQPTE